MILIYRVLCIWYILDGILLHMVLWIWIIEYGFYVHIIEYGLWIWYRVCLLSTTNAWTKKKIRSNLPYFCRSRASQKIVEATCAGDIKWWSSSFISGRMFWERSSPSFVSGHVHAIWRSRIRAFVRAGEESIVDDIVSPYEKENKGEERVESIDIDITLYW